MIRTKDFLLFVVVLVFLGTGISYTVSTERDETSTSKHLFVPTERAPDNIDALHEPESLDRDAIIAAYKAELISAPPDTAVAPSVTSAPETAETAATSSPPSDVLAIQACGTPDIDRIHAARWPLADVTVGVREGSRIVLHTQAQQQLVQTASGTALQTFVTEQPLLQLPTTPAPLDQSACVSSEIVGVTTAGALWYQSDAILYKNRGTEELLGYARDGYPIYGPYVGEVDECGGYQHATGYRYAIPVNELFTLACYRAAPSPLL